MSPLAYAFSRQADRRNTTDADIMRAVGVIDNRKSRTDNLKHGQETPDTPCGVSGNPAPPLDLQNQASAKKPRSSSQTAKIIGVSERKVERVRTIADRALFEALRPRARGWSDLHRAPLRILVPSPARAGMVRLSPPGKQPQDPFARARGDGPQEFHHLK